MEEEQEGEVEGKDETNCKRDFTFSTYFYLLGMPHQEEDNKKKRIIRRRRG